MQLVDYKNFFFGSNLQSEALALVQIVCLPFLAAGTTRLVSSLTFNLELSSKKAVNCIFMIRVYFCLDEQDEVYYLTGLESV